jgi:hypothetical protein
MAFVLDKILWSFFFKASLLRLLAARLYAIVTKSLFKTCDARPAGLYSQLISFNENWNSEQ